MLLRDVLGARGPGDDGGSGGASAMRSACVPPLRARTALYSLGAGPRRGLAPGSSCSPRGAGACPWPSLKGAFHRRIDGSSQKSGLRRVTRRRGVGGDVRGPWQSRTHARIAQGRRVGELEPELYLLAVGGWFHDLVKRTENRPRERRERSVRRSVRVCSRPTNP